MSDHPALDEQAQETLLGQIADEFTERLNRGEQPGVEEYVERHPEMAAVIRQILPALEVMRLPEPIAAAGNGSATAVTAPPQLGDYRIVRELGRGGMGIVYEAEQVSAQRRVALKVLPLGPAVDAKHLARFQLEAKTARELHHTNIVPVYEVGYEQGVHYYAMQYIDGRSLDHVLNAMRERLDASPRASQHSPVIVQVQDEQARQLASPLVAPPSPEPQRVAASKASWTASVGAVQRGYFLAVARMGVQVAEALEYAHQRNVVHRDIKPSNLILDQLGIVWISDFGLVKCLEGTDANLTRTGDVIGTARYMSPEQALAKRVPIDHRSDIYSLGVTLYELLTLYPAFDGADHEAVLRQIAFDEPAAPRQRNRAVPRDLETIVVKAMAKQPHERYPTAAALAADLRRYLTQEPILARPRGVAERLWKWAKRRPAAAALVVVTLLAALSLAIGGWWSNAELREANQRERQRAQEALEAGVRERLRAQEAEHRERIGRRYLYTAHLHLAQQAWERGHRSRMRELLEMQRPQAGQEDLRGFEWFYLWRLCHLDRFTLEGHLHIVSAAVFAPDGKLLATASHDRAIKLWHPATGKPWVTLHGHHGIVTSLAFAPDGKTFATGSHDQTVNIWDVDSGEIRAALRDLTTEINTLAYAPDGQHLAAGGKNGMAVVWDLSAGKEPVRLSGHTDAIGTVAFSPDGKCLATGGADQTVRLWDGSSGTQQALLPGHTDGVRSVAFSPDGKWLASGGLDRTVRLWEVATRQERRRLSGFADPVNAVAFSPDGQTLATGTGDPRSPLKVGDLKFKSNHVRSKPGEVKLWDVGTGLERLQFKGHWGSVYCVAFAPDGQTLATGSDDTTAMLWQVPAAQPAALSGHRREVNALAFAPDGQTLATVSDDRDVKLWDLKSGREKRTLHGHTGPIKFVTYTPDGRLLATAGDAGTIRLWDALTGQEKQTMKGHQRTIRSIAFSADGRTMATGAGDPSTKQQRSGEVKLWDRASGRERMSLGGHAEAVRSVAFSPEGLTLATCSDDQTVKLWDAGSGREQATFRGHTAAVRYVAFAPDGKTLASASNDHTIRLWEVATGRERSVLRGHRAAVLIVVFAPDGNTLTTGSTDGTVKFWDVVTGQERAVLEGHKGSIRAVGFSPDGKILATGDNDALVKLWYAGR